MHFLQGLVICALLLPRAAAGAEAKPKAYDPLAMAAGSWTGTAELGPVVYDVSLTLTRFTDTVSGPVRVKIGPMRYDGRLETVLHRGKRRLRVTVNSAPPFSDNGMIVPESASAVIIDASSGRGRADFYDDFSRCVVLFTLPRLGRISAVLRKDAVAAPKAKAGGGKRPVKPPAPVVIPLQ